MGAAMLVLLSRGDAALLGDVYDAGATHFLISPFGAVELGNAIRFTERYARRLGSPSRRTRDFDTRAAEAPAGWPLAHRPGANEIHHRHGPQYGTTART